MFLFGLSDIYVFEEFKQSEIRSWEYSINSTSVHVRFSRDFCNLLNIKNTDKENNMSLMGFGFYEKLGHLVEDSAEKEKGRVEFVAIRDRQIHSAAITNMHAGMTKLSSSMLRLCKQRKLFWREKFRDSSVKHTV